MGKPTEFYYKLHFKAEQVINHYNQVWQNMLPTDRKIEIKTTENIYLKAQ